MSTSIINANAVSHVDKFYTINTSLNSTEANSYDRLADQWNTLISYVKTLSGMTTGFVSVNGFINFPAFDGSSNLGTYYAWGILALGDAIGTMFLTQYHNGDVYMVKMHTGGTYNKCKICSNEIPNYVQVPKESSVTLTTHENATALMTTMYGAGVGFRGAWLVFGTESSYTPGLTVLQAPDPNYVVVTANSNGTVTIQNKSPNYPLNVQITLMKVTGSSSVWTFE